MTKRTASDEPRWLNPDEKSAWLAILTLVQRAFPEIERDMRVNHDLLGVHYHILVTLSDAPDNTMRLTDLAAEANVSQSRLTHRLKCLIERHDIEINQDPDDRRVKRATLTDQGATRLASAAPDHVETVRRVIFDHLTQAQTEALADALGPVAAALCNHPEYLNPQAAAGLEAGVAVEECRPTMADGEPN